MRLLLAEDDIMLGSSLSRALNAAGYQVSWHKDGESAELAAMFESFNVAVLDINLPKQSGLQILTKLRRKQKALPVLILTALDGAASRVNGLDSGADDYLAKPFDLEELLARLRAITRRSQGRAVNIMQAQNIIYDPLRRHVERDGKAITLQPKELKLLALLMSAKGMPVSKVAIEAELYDEAEEIESNAVEVMIYSLRKKLGQDFIRTLRGVGYMVPE